MRIERNLLGDLVAFDVQGKLGVNLFDNLGDALETGNPGGHSVCNGCADLPSAVELPPRGIGVGDYRQRFLVAGKSNRGHATVDEKRHVTLSNMEHNMVTRDSLAGSNGLAGLNGLDRSPGKTENKGVGIEFLDDLAAIGNDFETVNDGARRIHVVSKGPVEPGYTKLRGSKIDQKFVARNFGTEVNRLVPVSVMREVGGDRAAMNSLYVHLFDVADEDYPFRLDIGGYNAERSVIEQSELINPQRVDRFDLVGGDPAMGRLEPVLLGVIVLHEFLERSDDHIAVSVTLANGVALPAARSRRKILDVTLMRNGELRREGAGSLHELV